MKSCFAMTLRRPSVSPRSECRGRADGTHDSDLAAVPLSSPLETLLRRCPWPRLPKDDGHRLYQHPRTGPVSIPSSVSRARFTSPSRGLLVSLHTRVGQQASAAESFWTKAFVLFPGNNRKPVSGQIAE